VFKHFKQRPTVKGPANFTFEDVKYKERDIIPGVHQTDSYRSSVAVMGNIAYPIDVPNADSNLGNLAKLINCNLEMHFDIGELDFQASREGLSYIPQTIEAIKRKLTQLNDRLYDHVVERAGVYENLWDRAVYLSSIYRDDMWTEAVTKYAADTAFPLASNSRYSFTKDLHIPVDELRNKYNLIVRGFTTKYSSYDGKTSNLKTETTSVDGTWVSAWGFPIEANVFFVKNDTKTGAVERAKYHFLKNHKDRCTVFLLETADKDRPAGFDAFLDRIYNPPKVVVASLMDKKERQAADMNKVSVMKLSQRLLPYKVETVWIPAHPEFNDTTTYYYLPLSNYNAECKMDVSRLYDLIQRCGIADIKAITIYGVRKSHIKEVESNDNWINVETFLAERLDKITDEEIINMSLTIIDKHRIFSYTRKINDAVSLTSPVRLLNDKMKGVKRNDTFDPVYLESLLTAYSKPRKVNQYLDSLQEECEAVMKRYPLLNCISSFAVETEALAQYINLIDNQQ
jgi:hypothetical protein